MNEKAENGDVPAGQTEVGTAGWTNILYFVDADQLPEAYGGKFEFKYDHDVSAPAARSANFIASTPVTISALRSPPPPARPHTTTTSSTTKSIRPTPIMSLDDIFTSIVEKDTTKLDLLLSQNPKLINQTNDHSWTPLHMASRYGFEDGIKILIKKGANVKLLTNDGKSPVDLALSWNYVKCAEVMGYVAPTAGEKKGRDGGKVEYYSDSVNFFAGSVLNRLSEQRENDSWLLGSLENAKVLVFDGGLFPVLEKKQVGWVSRREVDAKLGRSLVDVVKELQARTLDGNSSTIPPIVFLGIDEAGECYWALDACGISALTQYMTSSLNITFSELRPGAFALSKREASILTQARSILDWNKRNLFCPSCGNKTRSGHAGYKRICLLDSCVSHKSVQNFSYPRTDPVAIVCITNQSNTHVLLGRQKSWPKGTYSCIAGFIESGETLEDGARREALEETGIKLGRVIYHSSQPWPFPSQLMIGMIGEAVTEDVKLVDKELEDARWFSREEVLEALRRPPTAWGRRGGDNVEGEVGDKKVTLNMPASYAIAHVIVKAWAEGDVKFPPLPKM
ncbi:Peroxisomal NADH pyrophosphatase nudt12 [Blyttiomyces sp. JEL0837]|nr:Peroxisomal NADH pyrophosphatase nudt12 [Blyttiomyces sp. JEL0837]